MQTCSTFGCGKPASSVRHKLAPFRAEFLGVVSAVAHLLALGVDVHPSGRLRLYEGHKRHGLNDKNPELVGDCKRPRRDDKTKRNTGPESSRFQKRHLAKTAATATPKSMRHRSEGLWGEHRIQQTNVRPPQRHNSAADLNCLLEETDEVPKRCLPVAVTALVQYLL